MRRATVVPVTRDAEATKGASADAKDRHEETTQIEGRGLSRRGQFPRTQWIDQKSHAEDQATAFQKEDVIHGQEEVP
jgi:hypothetical protein